MSRIRVIVDEAPGPGVEIVVESGIARAVAPRPGGVWLGFDRGHLVDSDLGDGTEMPVVVAVPGSTFVGCHIDAELVGALVEDDRTVLVATIAGHPLPTQALVRTVARTGDGHWIDAAAAEGVAREARQQFKVRSQARRIVGGRAWRAAGTDPVDRRFTTPHSRSEYRLERLPPRFIRGLEGLLDGDERILYAIERPPDSIASGRLGFARRGAERRAGLLLLSDRQLIWMVDHMAPDRYLMDWGVDARLVALEALHGVRLSGHETVRLHVETGGGEDAFALPAELRLEAEVLRDLLARFVPPGESAALVRRYEPAASEFDPGPATLFNQREEALQGVARIREALAPDELLAACYSPRREAVRRAATFGVTRSRAAVLGEHQTRVVALEALRNISMTLSPLVGRLELISGEKERSVALTYAATISSSATAVLRIVRRAWADAASRPSGLG
jgi:hypothetical protein